MKLEEIYPYWRDTHEELIDLLREVSLEKWQELPCHLRAGTIHQIVRQMVDRERWWIGHICQGLKWDDIRPKGLNNPALLIDAFQSARSSTVRFVDGLDTRTLRAVRVVPPDEVSNRPEESWPIAYILWNVLRDELAAMGQIQMRLKD